MAKYVKVYMEYEYPPAEAILKVEDDELAATLEGDGDVWDAVYSSSAFEGQVFDHAEEVTEEQAEKEGYWG